MPDLARLEALLDSAHAALLTADLARLGDLAPEIEMALAASMPAELGEPDRLAGKAERNERLLEAAMQGIRSARRRTAELTDTGRFSTYDAGGRRDQPGLSSPLAERRL